MQLQRLIYFKHAVLATMIPASFCLVKEDVSLGLSNRIDYNADTHLDNEMVANKLYEDLGDAENRSRLHVQYYVAKDQNVPLHARTKQRTCHIKLMIVDSHICVQGNGNQDTQVGLSERSMMDLTY